MPKSLAPGHSFASLDRVLNWAVTKPWALTRPMVRVVASVLARHLVGHEIVERGAFVARPTPAAAPAGNGIAVLPLHGVLAPRINLMSEMSGGATFEEATAQLRAAAGDPTIGTIVLDWDSPGGSCAGATEFAREVLAARKVKPVISHANFEMCSAAYWTGACATEVIAAPSAFIGSIGVYSIHEDLSDYLAQAGIKLTYVSAGKFKVDGNEAEPLSDHARERMQANVNAAYARFVGDVAKGRGISEAVVRGAYGQGDALPAEEALTAGLVDRIETLDETVARLQGRTVGSPLRALEPARDRAWLAQTEGALLALAL